MNLILKNTENVLRNYARDFEHEYKRQLKQDDWVASGSLINSVRCSFVHDRWEYDIELEVLDYWVFTEYGRGRTNNDSGDNLKLKIRKWIVDKGITPIDRSLGMTDKSLDSLAYLITRSIHTKGWKKEGTKPLETVLKEISRHYQPLLESALAKDISLITYEFFRNIPREITITL